MRSGRLVDITRRILGVLALATLASSACTPLARADNRPKITVRSSVNPAIYASLPLLLAVEKGYFAAEGIDIEMKKHNFSSVTQMPLVARGDLDIVNMVAGPALFNQKTEGFDIEIVASMSETHAGWYDGNWVMVRQDLWDSGAIRTLEAMRGHAIDGTTSGSAINFLINAALMKAGLTRSDVTYTSRLHTGPDMVTALQNKAVDVLPTIEPTATQMVDAGLAHRLASEYEITPWLQDTFIVSSAAFVQAHPAAVVGFLKAYLRAAQEIVAHGPRWTPEYVDILVRWSGLPADILSKVPGVPYYGQYGTISMDSLARQEAMWTTLDLVKQHVDPAAIVDTSLIDQARKDMGIR
jgi:NitT/TauT family transport system substrate-binding protein